jgi:hypothetical protein
VGRVDSGANKRRWRKVRSIDQGKHTIVLEHKSEDVFPKKIVVFGKLERDETSNMVRRELRSCFWGEKERRSRGIGIRSVGHDGMDREPLSREL